MSGFTYTIRSPFLPAILAQSSGLVVLGRSSLSLNSSRTAARRSDRKSTRLNSSHVSTSQLSALALHDALPISRWLEVLPGIDHAVDRAGLVLVLHAHERFHVHDPLPLLAGDLGPVVGVGRVGQVLALLELLADGGEEV